MTTLSEHPHDGHPAPTTATVGVIVPAAGPGRRLGGHGPKALVPLAGRPLLAHVLADLEATACVTAIVVAATRDAMATVDAVVAGGAGSGPFTKVVAVVPGGDTRRRSVAAGLAALPAGVTHAAVHDGTRPLAGPGYLDELLRLLLADPGGCCGVVPGVPVTDTVREVDGNGRTIGTIDRTRLRGIQTPQLFLRDVLERAHADAERAGAGDADDAALVERAGGAIRVIPGRAENLKVATVLDLLLAETLLSRRDGRQPSRPGHPAPIRTAAPPA